MNANDAQKKYILFGTITLILHSQINGDRSNEKNGAYLGYLDEYPKLNSLESDLRHTKQKNDEFSRKLTK